MDLKLSKKCQYLKQGPILLKALDGGIHILSSQISSPPKLNIFCCKAAGIIDGHHAHNKVTNLKLSSQVGLFLSCFGLNGSIKQYFTCCYFLPLAEIPGSIELLENSLTCEGVQWRKIIECSVYIELSPRERKREI